MMLPDMDTGAIMRNMRGAVNRRDFLKGAGLVVSAALTGCGYSAGSKPIRKPNVIVVLIS